MTPTLVLVGALSVYHPGDGHNGGTLACGGKLTWQSTHIAIRSWRRVGCGATAKGAAKMRDTIIAYVKDSVADLMYYDRKEDEDLPMGAIEQAVKDGAITAGEIVAAFADSLTEYLVNAEVLPKSRKTRLLSF